MPYHPELVDVLTNRNNNARIGAYLRETRLNAKNVNVTTFGKLFSRTVDGDLYAQPLIVTGVNLGKRGVRNIVFLATSRNWVYAYDAESPKEHLPLWQVNLGPPVPRQDVYPPLPDLYLNFGSEIGITSTPVIELHGNGKGVLYAVAKTRVEGVDAAKKEGFEYKIHALDIRTGRPFAWGGKKRSAAYENPKKITAIAHDSVTGQVAEFDAKWHLNRPGLLLLDGVLYLAFGSHGDEGQFWGWIMAYDAKTLEQLAVHCTALAWGEGGVWQSGCGLAGESVTGTNGAANYIYAVVGNGQKPVPEAEDGVIPRTHIIPAEIDVPFYGNCILKLTLVPVSSPSIPGRPPSQGDPNTRFRFDVVDWFTTSDCLDLNETDSDLIGGPVLFTAPGKGGKPTRVVLGGGKDGKFYLCDRDNLGKWHPVSGRAPFQLWTDGFKHKEDITLPYQVSAEDIKAKKSWVTSSEGLTQNEILQDDRLCNYHIHGAPVLWQKSETEITAYVWSEKDFCKAFKYGAGKFDVLDSTSLYGFPMRELRMPGGILALSADASKDGTGIVWASHPTDDDGMNKTVKGTLRAFDARDLNIELWNSDKNPDGDDRLGDFAKFCPPVVANGKVYMATFSRELVVYGLLKDVGKDRTNEECDIWDLKPIGNSVQGSCRYGCARYNIITTGLGLATPTSSPTAADSFYFAYEEIDSLEQPEMSISARILGVSLWLADPKERPDARVGVMIRASGGTSRDSAGIQTGLETAPYAAMVFSTAFGALFQRRAADNVAPIQDGPIDLHPPNWLRLSCESPENANFLRFKGEVSIDGIDWKQLGALAELPMQGRMMVGLFATAQTGLPDRVEASFSDVVIAPRVD